MSAVVVVVVPVCSENKREKNKINPGNVQHGFCRTVRRENDTLQSYAHVALQDTVHIPIVYRSRAARFVYETCTLLGHPSARVLAHTLR